MSSLCAQGPSLGTRIPPQPFSLSANSRDRENWQKGVKLYIVLRFLQYIVLFSHMNQRQRQVLFTTLLVISLFLLFDLFYPRSLCTHNCEDIPSLQSFKIEIPETEATLGAPGAILARGNEVSLTLPGRECDRVYVVERSYDMSLWEHVATTTFSTYPTQDPDFRSCENDVLDSGVMIGTRQLFYRYGVLDESGSETKWSAIGTVLIEAE